MDVRAHNFSPDPAAQTSLWSDALRTFMFGHARVEFATLFRPNGTSARQMNASIGIPYLGRLATRWNLNAATGIPDAVHGEIILGWKPYSVGLSIGRSRSQVIINYFRRRQPSMAVTSRELTRIVLEGGKAEAQVMGELKFYGRSLSINEFGEAVTYQLHREHLREAYRLLRASGSAEAAAFLKRNYAFIDENLVRRSLPGTSRGLLGFAAESLAYFGLGLGLAEAVPDGSIRHALQSGAAYSVAHLFRGGWTALRPLRLAATVGESIPVSLIHGLLSAGLDETGWRGNFRWLAEDFGTLAVYGRLKTLFFLPNRGLTARSLISTASAAGAFGLERELWTAARFARIGGALALGTLGLGSFFYLAGRSKPPDVDFAEIERRYGEEERARLCIPDSLPAGRNRKNNILPERIYANSWFRKEQSSSAMMIARFLEDQAGEERLTGPLRSGEVSTLQEALSRLSVAQRKALHDRLGSRLEVLLSLSREGDREIFYSSLLVLAGWLEDRQENSTLRTGLLYLVQTQKDFPELQKSARLSLQRGGNIFFQRILA